MSEITERCAACNKTLSDEATQMGWPIANLDNKYVGPCCFGDGAFCAEGHVLDAHSDSSECATCNAANGEPASEDA